MPLNSEDFLLGEQFFLEKKLINKKVWKSIISDGKWGPKMKVAQNGPKRILFLEFLKSDAIFLSGHTQPY